MAKLAPMELEVANLLIEALNLDMTPDELNPEISLFGEGGLELDSIDALELALAISKHYGFELRSDDPNNQQIFANLKSLAAYIDQHRIVG